MSESCYCQGHRWTVFWKSGRIFFFWVANNSYQSGFNQENRATVGIMGKMSIKGISIYVIMARAESECWKISAGRSGEQSLKTSAWNMNACGSEEVARKPLPSSISGKVPTNCVLPQNVGVSGMPGEYPPSTNESGYLELLKITISLHSACQISQEFLQFRNPKLYLATLLHCEGGECGPC